MEIFSHDSNVERRGFDPRQILSTNIAQMLQAIFLFKHLTIEGLIVMTQIDTPPHPVGCAEHIEIFNWKAVQGVPPIHLKRFDFFKPVRLCMPLDAEHIRMEVEKFVKWRFVGCVIVCHGFLSLGLKQHLNAPDRIAQKSAPATTGQQLFFDASMQFYSH